jgi:hypothetical protein
MQFDKQFHGGRSPFVLTGHGDEASRCSTEISALPASSEDDAPRRSTAAVAFPNFLLAVASWIFAQALAGCAAYGEAMYPGLVGVGEPVDQRDPVRGTQSEHGNPNQLLWIVDQVSHAPKQDGLRQDDTMAVPRRRRVGGRSVSSA